MFACGGPEQGLAVSSSQEARDANEYVMQCVDDDDDNNSAINRTSSTHIDAKKLGTDMRTRKRRRVHHAHGVAVVVLGMTSRQSVYTTGMCVAKAKCEVIKHEGHLYAKERGTDLRSNAGFFLGRVEASRTSKTRSHPFTLVGPTPNLYCPSNAEMTSMMFAAVQRGGEECCCESKNWVACCLRLLVVSGQS